MLSLFISKPLYDIEINYYPMPRSHDIGLLISAKPFLTITEFPNNLYLVIMDMYNKDIFTARAIVKKNKSLNKPACVRAMARDLTLNFTRQLRTVKVSNLVFSTVAKNEPVTEVTRTVLKEFKRLNMLAKIK